MIKKPDGQIDSYAAATIADAVEICCQLDAAMKDLRHSAYIGADDVILQIDAGLVRRHARKLINELLMMDYHFRTKKEKADQLKIVK